MNSQDLNKLSLEQLIQLGDAAYQQAKAYNARATEYTEAFKERTKDLSQGEIAGIIEKAFGA